MKQFLSLILIVFHYTSYLQEAPLNYAKFEPQNDNTLVFIGQDLAAVGGLDDYSNGYADFFEIPAGVTTYTNLSPGDESFGHFNKGLDGLNELANWGAGDSCAQLYIDSDSYKNTAIAIGLSMVNHEKKVARGKHDDLIIKLANWIKKAQRPVFLRIGYEFDGWKWNHYKRKHYLKSWERIHDIFTRLEVDNCAFVWQSKGNGTSLDILEAWYPGDQIVDWCGYSYLGNPDRVMLDFARLHHKPVFIAEATPVRQTDNLFFNTDLKKQDLGKQLWENWYVPFFNTINNNRDVIKAFSYINTDWSSQMMWINNPAFKQVDSRLQVNEYIAKRWKEELQKPTYLNKNDNPF